MNISENVAKSTLVVSPGDTVIVPSRGGFGPLTVLFADDPAILYVKNKRGVAFYIGKGVVEVVKRSGSNRK